ncbi:hypothetical protein pipiens_018831 [Culex pipiens pipiens]|uniref:Uncharacterized protein n=1 Tax=Culex pipiens pipiens TaxID=38569 RepID=A0ABD1DXY6_CULPP
MVSNSTFLTLGYTYGVWRLISSILLIVNVFLMQSSGPFSIIYKVHLALSLMMTPVVIYGIFMRRIIFIVLHWVYFTITSALQIIALITACVLTVTTTRDKMFNTDPELAVIVETYLYIAGITALIVYYTGVSWVLQGLVKTIRHENKTTIERHPSSLHSVID